MPRQLNIIVGGYIVGLPLAGMSWHHLHYLLGLHRLGHRVTFFEDSGPWLQCFDPVRNVVDADPTYGLNYLRQCLDRLGLPPRFSYISRHTGPGELAHFGMTEAELHDELRKADLFLAVSGVTPWHDSRPTPRRSLAIDTDPVYTQLKLQENAELLAYWQRFDAVASFGTRLCTAGCDVPTAGFDWQPTRQPVVLDAWHLGPPPPGAAMTTVGRWAHDEGRTVEVAGRQIPSSKAESWREVRELPTLPGTPLMAIAMDKMPADDAAAFRAAGWRLDDPVAATNSLDAFADFIQNSLGEFTVAKRIYAETASGWFSDRAACYLAAARPAVVQDTGFATGPLALPTGEGLLTWQTPAEAAAALQAVAANPAKHAAAAREVARQHLAHDRVLPNLLEFGLS
jgi:hypothetical protein